MRFRLLRQNSEQWTVNRRKLYSSGKQHRAIKPRGWIPTQPPPNNKKHQAQKERAGVMTVVFSALNTKNLAPQAWNRTLFKCSSLPLRSIKESSVTSRLSMTLKWLLFFFLLQKEAEEPPIFKSCSNGMKSVKGQNNVQKHPFPPQVHSDASLKSFF